jgi:CPA1 family monovalent cation:H+ antiporter
MISVTSVLALFLLLVISSVIFFLSKRIKLPYTVLLVLFGLIIIPLVQLPWLKPVFGFMTEVQLTPEMLFYIFLPILIFESAFNINMRKMVESAWSIFALSVVGLLISAFTIAIVLYLTMPLIGMPVPFVVLLLFGSIISATDPVAVLALFKEFGAPKRLTLIFEGESLFNDGTAVALFMVVLAIAQYGFHGAETLIEGMGIFLMMVLLGVLFGLFMAALFARGLRYTRSNEFVSITLLIVSAHLVFIVSELINANAIFGFHIHISSIIAATISSLFLGNYARHTLSPKSDEYLNKSIEHLAFVANSLVFLLAGMLFANTKIDLADLFAPILLTIVVVAVARAISVYAVIWPLNKSKREDEIPQTWQALLAWGSLRGALAIIVVLLIPDDMTLRDWPYAYSPKELLLALTIGCILATLFVKALTIGPLIRKLKINKPSPFQRAYYIDLGLYYLHTEGARLKEQNERGFVSDDDYKAISKKLLSKTVRAVKNRKMLMEKYGSRLFEKTLRHVAMDIEIHYLRELYGNNEVSEANYRKIKGKINLQKESIEHNKYEEHDKSSYIDRKDIFDRMVLFVQATVAHRPRAMTAEERYQYYRAQSIISRKVAKTLNQMQNYCQKQVFDKQAYDKVIDLYNEFHRSNEEKIANMLSSGSDKLKEFVAELSMKSLRSSGNKALNFMIEKGIAVESTAHDIEHKYSI